MRMESAFLRVFKRLDQVGLAGPSTGRLKDLRNLKVLATIRDLGKQSPDLCLSPFRAWRDRLAIRHRFTRKQIATELLHGTRPAVD